MTFKHSCTAENAGKFMDWIKNRGGVAVWRSVNLSDPGASWSTPAKTADGQPMPKPTWQADNVPVVFTDPTEIGVFHEKAVKRFRVAVRSHGLALKVTDGGTRRIRAAVARAGEDAYYAFDYETQEAVIYVRDRECSLAEFGGTP